MIRTTLFAVISSVLMASSCTDTGSSSISDPNLQNSDQELATIGEQFLPASMLTTTVWSGDRSSQSIPHDEICSEVLNDLVDCQPIQLRVHGTYISEAFSNLYNVFESVSSGLGNVSLSSQGVQTDVTDSSYVDSASYRKDDNSLELVGQKNGDAVYYFSQNSSQMEIRYKDPSSGLSYQLLARDIDSSSWHLEFMQLGRSCVSADVRGPERIKLVMDKDLDTWVGKMMTYHPRWAFGQSQPATCDTDPSASSKQTIYVDFVATEQATKGKIFFFSEGEPNNFQEGSYESSFGLPGVCDTSSAIVCEPIDEQTNPFCNLENTLVGVYGDDCSGSNADVSSALFGDFADWDDPLTFAQESITIPDTESL